MTKKNLILAVAGLIITGLYMIGHSQPFETIEISAPDNKFSRPVWSPDGTMVACETYKTNKIRVFKLGF